MKRIVLVDELTKKEFDFALGGKGFGGDEQLEIEFQKRIFAKGLVRQEWEEKGLISFDDVNETFVVDPGHKIRFEIECLKRERNIHTK